MRYIGQGPNAAETKGGKREPGLERVRGEIPRGIIGEPPIDHDPEIRLGSGKGPTERRIGPPPHLGELHAPWPSVMTEEHLDTEQKDPMTALESVGRGRTLALDLGGIDNPQHVTHNATVRCHPVGDDR